MPRGEDFYQGVGGRGALPPMPPVATSFPEVSPQRNKRPSAIYLTIVVYLFGTCV